MSGGGPNLFYHKRRYVVHALIVFDRHCLLICFPGEPFNKETNNGDVLEKTIRLHHAQYDADGFSDNVPVVGKVTTFTRNSGCAARYRTQNETGFIDPVSDVRYGLTLLVA